MSQQKKNNVKLETNNQTPALIQGNIVSSSKSVMVGSHFKLGKRIGKGNFGEVRIGRDVRNNEDVAIKIVFFFFFISFYFTNLTTIFRNQFTLMS